MAHIVDSCLLTKTRRRLVEPPRCYQLAEDDGDEGTREIKRTLPSGWMPPIDDTQRSGYRWAHCTSPLSQ